MLKIYLYTLESQCKKIRKRNFLFIYKTSIHMYTWEFVSIFSPPLTENESFIIKFFFTAFLSHKFRNFDTRLKQYRIKSLAFLNLTQTSKSFTFYMFVQESNYIIGLYSECDTHGTLPSVPNVFAPFFTHMNFNSADDCLFAHL